MQKLRQFAALITLLITLERVLALEFLNVYRKKWKEHYKYYLILLAFALTMFFISVAVVTTYISGNKNPTSMCSVLQATGPIYGTIHFILIALVYLLCFIVLKVIFKRINRRRAPSKDEAWKQKMLLVISGISVILVTVPNVVLCINDWQIPRINDLAVGVTYCLYTIHSGLSLFVYTAFRPDFRHRLLCILQLRRLGYQAQSTKSARINSAFTVFVNVKPLE
ncbi:unnamed protein product [Cylicocyclus nassatus]|uniref:G-protein coupled receptors family 1 profile domain-containing protein n=1 Tax=Cylicocyclus nassatus TaxID=53992 RepID=A0AA36GT96_CYLNA|nr:unnamed protein product [Cylicocyclus nassatus]